MGDAGAQAVVGFSWLGEITENIGRGVTHVWHRAAELYDRLNDRRLALLERRKRAGLPPDKAQKRKARLAATLRSKQQTVGSPGTPQSSPPEILPVASERKPTGKHSKNGSSIVKV